MPSRSKNRQSAQSTPATVAKKPLQESNPGWGNGFLTDLSSDTSMDNTGSFGESILDMTRRLGASGQGTNEMWGAGGGGYSRDTDSWGHAGLGIGAGWGSGMGVGIGGGKWSASNTNDAGRTRKSSGVGFGAGTNQVLGYSYGDSSVRGERYKGVGGNAYTFNESAYTDEFGKQHAGTSGFGLDGSYTPLGYNNANLNLDTSYGSGGVSMENAVVGKMAGSGEVGRADDGTVFGRGSWAPGRTEVHGLKGNLNSALGKTNASMGSYGTGPRYQGDAHYNPNTGSFGGGAQWAGGGWKVTDAALSHEFNDGTKLSASAGKIDTANAWAYNGGWNNETKNLTGDGKYATGNTVTNVNASYAGKNGYGANAHLGEYSDGVSIKGKGSIGADGVHLSGDGSGGGYQIKDLGGSVGKKGETYQSLHMDSFSNRTTATGASLDIDRTGVDAKLKQLRTGGFRMNGLSGQTDFNGMSAKYGVGEISNDMKLDGAHFSANKNGVNAGFRELDAGGIRVKDVKGSAKFGDMGTAEVHAGSFTDGNNLQGVDFNANKSGASLDIASLGIMGMDGEKIGGSWKGTHGDYASANVGKFHTGIGASGVNVTADANGLSASADNVNYNAMELTDVKMKAGMKGIYDSELSLGHGSFNSFDANNVYAGVNKDGLSVSADDISYDYLAAQNLHSKTSIGGGAITSNVDLGKGSFGGGSADHFSYNTNLINQDMSVDKLNAHGLQLEDVAVGGSVGKASANVGADKLNVLDLNVGHAESHSKYMGLQGNGNVQDANLDLLNVKGGNASLSYGGKTVLGAKGDVAVNAGVDNASADWDLLHGKANGSFDNLHAGGQLNNASVNFMGSEIAIPDMGAHLNASGKGNVDLGAGKASGSVNLAGSSVNFAGHELELGDWAQASGDVDLAKGAVNANIGGDNGVGVNASIAEGNLDLNLFGTKIDVDEGISDAWEGTKDIASDAWDGTKAAASYVASLLPSISLW